MQPKDGPFALPVLIAGLLVVGIAEQSQDAARCPGSGFDHVRHKAPAHLADFGSAALGQGGQCRFKVVLVLEPWGELLKKPWLCRFSLLLVLLPPDLNILTGSLSYH